MLTLKTLKAYSPKVLLGLMLSSTLFLSGCSVSINGHDPLKGNWPTINQVIINIAKVAPAVNTMVWYLSYAIGFMLIVSALMKIKRNAEQRSAMTGQGIEMKGPLLHFVAGAMLMFLPHFFSMMMTTVFNQSGPTMIPHEAGSLSSKSNLSPLARAAALRIIQCIGLIAVVRGWILLSQLSQQGGQPGRLSKAITHIIAGLFAVNAYGVWQIWVNTIMPGAGS